MAGATWVRRLLTNLGWLILDPDTSPVINRIFSSRFTSRDGVRPIALKYRTIAIRLAMVLPVSFFRNRRLFSFSSEFRSRTDSFQIPRMMWKRNVRVMFTKRRLFEKDSHGFIEAIRRFVNFRFHIQDPTSLWIWWRKILVRESWHSPRLKAQDELLWRQSPNSKMIDVFSDYCAFVLSSPPIPLLCARFSLGEMQAPFRSW